MSRASRQYSVFSLRSRCHLHSVLTSVLELYLALVYNSFILFSSKIEFIWYLILVYDTLISEGIRTMKKQEIKAGQGEHLKKSLAYAKMNQTQLAETGFASKQLISNIINERAPLTADNAYKFARVLGVRPEYLLMESEYMTESERIKSISAYNNRASSLCCELIEALGYRIIDTKTNPDGSSESMHRPYSRITINKSIDAYSSNDSDNDILQKARESIPVRIYVIESPSGKRAEIEMEEFHRMIKYILNFIEFQLDIPFHRFDFNKFPHKG